MARDGLHWHRLTTVRPHAVGYREAAAWSAFYVAVAVAFGRVFASAYEVRRLITRLMWPQEDIGDRLASPDIPGLLDRDPDLARITRRSGGTIAPDGGPLTTAGWGRIRQWRADWLALPSQVKPAVIGPDQVLRSGVDGLGYLADLASTVGVTPVPHAHACGEPTSGWPAVRAA